MNKRLLIITVHIAAWACFFLLPVVFFPRPNDPDFKFSQPIIWMFVTINIFLVIFYYTNTHVLIPKLLARKKWFLYTVTIILILLVFAQIPRLFEDAIRAEMPEKLKALKGHKRRSIIPYPFTGSTAVFFLVFTVSTCIKVIQQWLGAEKKKQEIENEKLSTELSFLKSQINPHFFFNTLNNIYSLALVKSDATPDAVLKLSSIMRYVLNETKQNLVPLEKEIKFIHDFIELHKVRLTDKVKVKFEVNGDIEGCKIAPLILMPFVENAFKYGISTRENSEINIRLDVDETSINFYSSNRVISAEKDKFENNGIGISNTRRRLELLYPGTHKLEVEEKDNMFTVQLTLNK